MLTGFELYPRWVPLAHEQNNVILKGFGGILDLGENSEALRCWMVAGPEVAGCLGNLKVTSVPCSTKERSKESTTTKIIPNRKPSRMTSLRNLAKIIADFGIS